MYEGSWRPRIYLRTRSSACSSSTRDCSAYANRSSAVTGPSPPSLSKPEQNPRLPIVATAVPLRQTTALNRHAACLTSQHHGYRGIDFPFRLPRLFPKTYPERVRTSPSVLEVADQPHVVGDSERALLDRGTSRLGSAREVAEPTPHIERDRMSRGSADSKPVPVLLSPRVHVR